MRKMTAMWALTAGLPPKITCARGCDSPPTTRPLLAARPRDAHRLPPDASPARPHPTLGDRAGRGHDCEQCWRQLCWAPGGCRSASRDFPGLSGLPRQCPATRAAQRRPKGARAARPGLPVSTSTRRVARYTTSIHSQASVCATHDSAMHVQYQHRTSMAPIRYLVVALLYTKAAMTVAVQNHCRASGEARRDQQNRSLAVRMENHYNAATYPARYIHNARTTPQQCHHNTSTCPVHSQSSKNTIPRHSQQSTRGSTPRSIPTERRAGRAQHLHITGAPHGALQ